MSAPRKYPHELRERAVRYVFESDRSIKDVAEELGIKYESLRWNADRKDQTVKKAMNVLQTCLQKAVVWGELQVNPVREVKKPSGKRTRAVRPVAPREIEIMRSHMLEQGKDRDAALLVVLGYAGLRPGEALALRWDHVRSKTLLIE